MKEVIDLLEKAILDMRSNALLEAEEKISATIAKLQTPRYETPGQYKERTGKEWPDDWAVYIKVPTDMPIWQVRSFIDAQSGYITDLLSAYEITNIICATEAGAPPDDWKPEEEVNVPSPTIGS
jgi:hypothetical protein